MYEGSSSYLGSGRSSSTGTCRADNVAYPSTCSPREMNTAAPPAPRSLLLCAARGEEDKKENASAKELVK